MSHQTKPSEQKQHSYVSDVLAIVETLKKWRVFRGIRFNIATDSQAFKMTMDKDDIPAKISGWVMFLQQLNYEIEHRTGTKMQHVYALSRFSCLVVESTLTHKLLEVQISDKWTKAIIEVLKHTRYAYFYLGDGILYKVSDKELIVVPR